MAGIYFILPKTGRRGYIGLDKNMTQSSYPRLVDHVAAAYNLYGRDVYRKGGVKLAGEGDINSSQQKCEEEMRSIGCCNYNYYVTYEDDDCYSLGEENYNKFATIWTINKSTEEAKMSWAEVCYVYKYFRTFAALNEKWGGEGSFVINHKSFPNIKLGNTTLQAIVEKLDIKWGKKPGMARDLKLMDELFFPHAKIFNKVINYYVNNTLADEISDAIKEAIKTKELWQQALNQKTFTVVYSLDDLKLLYEELTKNMSKNNYEIPGFENLKNEVEKQIQASVKYLLSTVTDSIYTSSGKINKNKKFKISYNPTKLCIRKSGGDKYPFWWPATTTIPKKHSVEENMKNLVIHTLFPHLVKHTSERFGKRGIDKDAIWSYMKSQEIGIAKDQLSFLEGFYYPARNLWLENYYGSVTYTENVGEDILIHRSAWKEDVYIKLKRSAYTESSGLKDLTVW